MHPFITLRRLLIVCFISAGFLSACTRINSTDIGGDLIPPIDGVTTIDTLIDVVSETFDSNDTVRVYKADNHFVGAITNDPLFGKTKASMYFELKPLFYPYYIAGNKDSLKIDSAVLILSYNGVYGDSTQPIRLNVAEISQSTPLDIATAYPANYPNFYPISTSGALAAPQTFDIRRLGDSVNNRYENAVRQIRIRLNPAVATRFLKTYDSTNAYQSDSIFRTYFAGFALTADAVAPANALLKINLSDTNTKCAFYYSSSSTGATSRDTSVAYFRFGTSTSGDANYITRDRTGSEVARHFATTATPKPDSLVYVQTSPGTYVRIRIPGLKNLSNRLIHRAELIAEQVPDDANLATTETQMLPPRYLLLSVFDSVNNIKRNVPNDYVFSTTGPNASFFGGYLAYKSAFTYDKVAAYTFNISRYVQGIVTRKDTSFTLRLSAPANDSLSYKTPYPDVTAASTVYLSPTIGNDVAEGRVRLGGGTHSRFRMRLRIIFSRI